MFTRNLAVFCSSALFLCATLLPRPVCVGQSTDAEALENVKIDFSTVGYEGGSALPWVPAVMRVQAVEGDNTALLQAAVDQVAVMPLQENGFRGAIELEPGFFMVDGQLKIRASGIVIRGCDRPDERTYLLANGSSRRSFIMIAGTEPEMTDTVTKVVDEAHAGAIALKLGSLEGISEGSRIQITRPSTETWIEALGTDFYENAGSFADLRVFWRPGSRDLIWDRTVVEVDESAGAVILDAPVTCAISMLWGGAEVRVLEKHPANPRLSHVGIENLVLLSAFDGARPMDEEHSWYGITMDRVEDVWVRAVEFHHFVGSAIRVGPRARRVSLFDCTSLEPVSETGGYRRWTFWIEGQQVWVDRCEADSGLHDFTAGQLAGGPIVFHNCVAHAALGPSGTFESWASGVLFENVTMEGAGLEITLDWAHTQGAGWTAGNSVVWNCDADSFAVSGPESAPNWLIRSDVSLFESQRENVGLSGKPVYAERPASETAVDDLLFFTLPCDVKSEDINARAIEPLEIQNGRFVIGGSTVWGGFVDEKWWRGQTLPAIAESLGQRSITRFCPGREGAGLTENLEEMAQEYMEKGDRVFYGGVGLWYDRRRDDHRLNPRDSGDVWAPFFEMPWARSGKGIASDGLSQFDLGTYNPWFFDRTREFAGELANRGMVHLHYLYNTHNVLETLAHYVDYPWRPVNCVNDVGLQEPPQLDAGQTVHLANAFFNVEHPGRRALHRSYIRHTLDQLADAETLILTLGTQFAGPLAFQEFFIQTVEEWEVETGRNVKLMLETSKDITDAILSNPNLAAGIDGVSMRYWQYLADGTLWAPRGDQNRAFREMNTLRFGVMTDHPPATTPLELYRQVREYRDRYPGLAVIVWHGGVGSVPGLMAGAANVIGLYRPLGMQAAEVLKQPMLDDFVRKHLSPFLMQMLPVEGKLEQPEKNWCLADPQFQHVLISSLEGEQTIGFREGWVDHHPSTPREALWFQPETGETLPLETDSIQATLEKPDERCWLLWLGF